jgi:3-oxoacyl-[acyl-carrier protein] reductase
VGALDGRLALVTGGSRGIGRAVCDRLLGAGADLVVCARDPERLAHVAAVLAATHPRARLVAVPCDVANPADVDRLRLAAAPLGTPDILVNNAGVVVRRPLHELSPAEWSATIDVNLNGTYHVIRAFLAAMRARGSGRIINIASITGRRGTANLTAYAAAKHGVVGLTRALAEETRDVGIAVNALCPGSVDTDMLRGSGFAPSMSADEVAGVVLYLAGDAPRQLTGACLDVFG